MKCEVCNGTGMVGIGPGIRGIIKCDACHGTGLVQGHKAPRIEIALPNGYKLVAERNTDPQYDREMFIGIVDPDGVWHQDLAVVRSDYSIDDGKIVWDDKKFEVLVYGDKGNEDFTDAFTIGLYEEEE